MKVLLIFILTLTFAMPITGACYHFITQKDKVVKVIHKDNQLHVFTYEVTYKLK